jgi:hypothetical protein
MIAAATRVARSTSRGGWARARLPGVFGLALLCLGSCKSSEKRSGADTATTATATGAVPLLFPADAAPSVSPFKPPVAKPEGEEANVLAVVNPEGLPKYAGPTGTLVGNVYVTGDAPPTQSFDYKRCNDARRAEEMYGKLFREEALDGKRALLDAVVGVIGYGDAYIPAPQEPVRVEIKNCALSARTYLLTFGQSLNIFNLEAPKKTNFFAVDLQAGAGPALMVAPPQGEPTNVRPRKVGHDLLVDKMDRPFLVADVFVTRHPLHAVTRAAGAYRISGIPVGELQAMAFHPAFGDAGRTQAPADASASREAPQGQPVTIKANETTRLDFVLTYRRGVSDRKKAAQ